jgi:hypothetical protein
MVQFFKNDVKIDGKMKTKIRNDLLIEFPEYKRSSSCSLDKRIGCLLLGIGYYINHGTDIRMKYSSFNLSNPLDFMCANLSMEPKNRWKVNWPKYEQGLYKEMAQELRDLAPIPIEGNVTLSQIINGYKNYNLDNVVENRHFEDPALIAAWCGRLDVAKNCLDWGKQAYYDRFKGAHNFPTIDDWYAHMLTRISNPETLHRIVDEQVTHHKLEKMPYQDIIIDI